MSLKGSFLYIFIGVILAILIRNSGYYFLALGIVAVFVFLIIKYNFKIAVLFVLLSSFFMIYRPNEDTLNLNDSYIDKNYTIEEVKESYLIVNDGNDKFIVYLSSLSYDEDETQPELLENEVIEIKGDLSKIESSLDMDIFDFSKYLKNKRIYYQITAYKIYEVSYTERLNVRIVNFLLSKLSDDSYKMVKMLVFNDKNADAESYENLKSINAMHLFVVSGFHITFFYNLILFFFKRLEKAGEIIAIFVCVFYVYLLSFPISALRAVASLIIYKFFKEYLNRLDSVAIPGIIFLFMEPMNVYNYSFILTFIMTLTITFASSFLDNLPKFIKPFVLSFVCFLAMIPIQLIMNYEINFISVLSNIVLSYVVMVIFVCCLLSMIISGYNGNMFGFIYEKFNDIIERISNANTTVVFGSMPYYLVMVYYVVFIFLILSFEKKSVNKVVFHIASLLAIMIGLYNRQYFIFYQQVTFLNVYQGDCCIIQDSFNGGVMFIDTGGLTYYDIASKKIIPYLKYHGIRSIDMVVITHDDNDHCGALENLKELIEIKEIIQDQEVDEINMGKINLKNLNHYYTEDSEENEKSLVLYGKICDMYFMFTGDAPQSIEKQIIADYDDIDTDILKVGHHGSYTSTSEEFVDYITPTYAVISVGKNNTYGHPHEVTLETLTNANAIIYRTDTDGTVKVTYDLFKKYYIKTAK